MLKASAEGEAIAFSSFSFLKGKEKGEILRAYALRMTERGSALVRMTERGSALVRMTERGSALVRMTFFSLSS